MGWIYDVALFVGMPLFFILLGAALTAWFVGRRGYEWGYDKAIGLLPDKPLQLRSALVPGAVYKLEATIPRGDDCRVVILRRVTADGDGDARAYCTLESPPPEFIMLEDGRFMACTTRA